MYILRNVIHRLFEAAGADGAASGGDGGGDQAAQQAAVEQRAREMGWSPKEQWRGNPDHWIDASTFVQRGEQVLPILQANLRQRDAQLATLRQTSQQQAEQLRAANEAIQVLTNISTEQGRTAAKEKRRELLKQQAQARTDGNTDLEIELGEQIADVTAEIQAGQEAAAASTKSGKKPQQQQRQQPPAGDSGNNDSQNDPTRDPNYIAFRDANPWFGTDRRKTALATAIGEELRADPANANLVGKAFFDRITAEVNKVFAPARPASKVEGAANGGGGNNAGEIDPASGKSYADLPADAKEACLRQGKALIGEGKAFKTEAEWRKYYVSMYFNS